jgi:hypothetical protein
MTLQEIQRDQLLDWLHSPRGGWGYIFRVPVRVIGTTATGRVKVIAPLSSGSVRVRYVMPERLTQRQSGEAP